MKRIFTLAIAAFLLAISGKSFAQCTFNTTVTSPNPGASYTFTTNAEGFTGNINHSGGAIHTNNVTTATITTPVFNAVQPGTSQIIVRFNLDRNGSNSITGYAVTATTNANPSIALCSATGLNISPNSNPVFYLTIPIAGLLPPSVNFQLNITFTQTGDFDIDNFGATVAGTGATLPVKFTSLDAKAAGSNINLTWNVAEELNVDRYEVERSLDGKSYVKLGAVNAAGQRSYSLVDQSPAQGTAYYRIKSVDLDDSYAYSTVVSVKGGKSSVLVRAFPMPFHQDLTIQHNTADLNSSISISAEDGRMVKAIKPSAGTQQTVVDLSSLKAGLYLVRFDNGKGEIETIKVVKQ